MSGNFHTLIPRKASLNAQAAGAASPGGPQASELRLPPVRRPAARWPPAHPHATMGQPRRGVALALLLLLCGSASAVPDQVRLERVSVRVSYVSQAERLTRRAASADAPDFTSGGVPAVTVDAGDTLLVQASCAEGAYPQQAFLRFVRADTGADSVYLLRRKSIDVRKELSMQKEIRADRDFWAHDATYRAEIVIGDTRMAAGVTWVAIEAMRFTDGSAGVFAKPAGNVFDFDVGVKRRLLPEFTTPLPPEEKQAPAAAVALALAALLLPFPLVFLAWSRLGVFPLAMREGSAAERSAALGFEACRLAHVGALGMFWLQWNIIYTWKVMAALMLPTLCLGHKALSAAASRHVQRTKKGK
jgi:hypothetical protein